MSDTAHTSTTATVVNWIAAGLIVLALLVTMRALPIESATAALGDRLDMFGDWAPIVFGAIYALATVLLLPGWILTIAAGAFFGLVVGTIVVSLASTTGAALCFLVARYVARDYVAEKMGDHARLSALDDAIGEGGWKVVALLRLSPAIPFNLQNYLYGLTKIRFRPYVLASWLAMLPGTFLYVYIGHIAGAVVTGSRERSLAEWIALGVGFLATIAVTVYVTWLARQKMKDRTKLDEQSEGSDRNGSDSNTSPSLTWRPVVAATGAAIAIAVAVSAHVQKAELQSVVAGWVGPPDVQMREAYTSTAGGSTFDHSTFTALLATHVDDAGWVDYASLRGDQDLLDDYIASIARAPFTDLDRDEKLALLLNAYNAFTLRVILDHRADGTLTSIRDIPSELRWQDQRWHVGDHVWSLDQLEHEQIRPKFREPRIHFALVCAAVGCPPLRNEAYVPGRLDAQLEDQTQYVHDHPTWFRFDREDADVHLTPLYDWFAGDFEQVAGSTLAFAARYSDSLAGALERDAAPSIEWIEYDWRLNDVANKAPR